MEVEFEMTAEDMIALRRHMQKRGPNRQQYSLITAFCIIFLLVTVLYGVVKYLGPRPLGVYLAMLVLGIGVGAWMTLIVLALYAQLKAPHAFRKALQQSNYAEKVLGWRRFSIDSQGVCNKSEIFCSIYLWKGIDKIVKTSEHIFIYVTRSAAFAVPRRAFADDKTFHAFADAATRYHAAAGFGEQERPRLTGIQTPEQTSKPGTVEGIIPKDDGPRSI